MAETEGRVEIKNPVQTGFSGFSSERNCPTRWNGRRIYLHLQRGVRLELESGSRGTLCPDRDKGQYYKIRL